MIDLDILAVNEEAPRITVPSVVPGPAGVRRPRWRRSTLDLVVDGGSARPLPFTVLRGIGRGRFVMEGMYIGSASVVADVEGDVDVVRPLLQRDLTQ